VQPVGFRPTFKGEVFEDEASGTNSGGTTGQEGNPFLPLFAIELLKSCSSLLLMLSLAQSQNLQQSASNRVVSFGQTVDPFLHDVNVAQFSQLPE